MLKGSNTCVLVIVVHIGLSRVGKEVVRIGANPPRRTNRRAKPGAPPEGRATRQLQAEPVGASRERKSPDSPTGSATSTRRSSDFQRRACGPFVGFCSAMA